MLFIPLKIETEELSNLLLKKAPTSKENGHNFLLDLLQTLNSKEAKEFIDSNFKTLEPILKNLPKEDKEIILKILNQAEELEKEVKKEINILLKKPSTKKEEKTKKPLKVKTNIKTILTAKTENKKISPKKDDTNIIKQIITLKENKKKDTSTHKTTNQPKIKTDEEKTINLTIPKMPPKKETKKTIKIVKNNIENEKPIQHTTKKIKPKAKEKITQKNNQTQESIQIIQHTFITHQNQKIKTKIVKRTLEFKKSIPIEHKIIIKKDIKNLQDLVKFSEDLHLNLKKVKFSIKKVSTNHKKEPTPKLLLPKIPTENLVKNHKKIVKKINIKKPKEEKITLETIFNFKEKKTPKKVVKKEETIHSSQNNQTPIINYLKANIAKAKESIKHFSNALKEAIENYKPPIQKLTLQMHPKELGEVEVTLIKRGDNLQIQINSNNQAVNFLNSQQQELRQNLVNMGFTNINMNFNSNQDSQKDRNYKPQQNKNNNEEEEELIIEIPYQYA